jgi:hypothetical protein
VREPLSRCVGPLSIAGAFVLLAWWSWGKWTDVQIDFGVELYIPWRLSQGEALYRDIAYRNGPLPPYLNALWFRLFGVSLTTLVYCNLAILAGICALTHHLLRRSCDRLTAAVGCLVLLGVFGFSQYVGIANYNYVTPYQHAQTHGLALSIALIAAISRYLGTERIRWLALAGVCLGLVFLTKLELLAAAAAACGLGWVFVFAGWPMPVRSALRRAAVFAVAFLLPVAAFFVFLALQMPAATALEGVLGNWRYLGAGILVDPFYRSVLGLDDVSGNLWLALRMSGGVAGFAVLGLAADRLLRRAPGPRAAWGAAAGLAVFLAMTLIPAMIPWMEVARALPLTTLLAALALVGFCLRRRRERETLVRWAPLALWAVFSLVLLGKMILHARFFHYGFALAMPATLLLVACLVGVGPAAGRARLGGSGAFRMISLAAIASGVLFLLHWSDEIYARKDFVVGKQGDAIVVESPVYEPRGQVVSEALLKLEAIMGPEATLLVLPEGASLNYWLRRSNSTRYSLFLPVEIDAFGGDEIMLRDLRAHRPDFVALVQRDHAEFGVGPFGVDPRNGRGIMSWVAGSYQRVGRIGAEPFRNRGFGIVILRRSDRAEGALER